jgi:hypothetical protein
MKASLVATILLFTLATGLGQKPVPFSGPKPSSANPTKQELVRWLGYPALIELFPGGGVTERWTYFCRGANGQATPFDFGFSKGRVSSSGAWPDPSALLSTDRESDLKLIAKFFQSIRRVR